MNKRGHQKWRTTVIRKGEKEYKKRYACARNAIFLELTTLGMTTSLVFGNGEKQKKNILNRTS